MREGVFVTGTGTDVGKTYVSALLVKTLRMQGRSAGYFKPALSGASRRDGALVPGDAEEVCRVSGLPGPAAQYVAYLYEHAVSPHLAARLEGPPITRERIIERFSQVAARFDYLVAEGCGGLFCPLNDGEKPLLLGDVAAMLGLPLVIVSPSGLGAINAAVLTAEYAAKLGLPVLAAVMNGFEAGNPLHEDNRVQIERFTGLRTICVARDARTIELP